MTHRVLELLEQHPLTAASSKDTVRDPVSASRIRTAQDGEVFYRPSDTCHALSLVIEGCLYIEKTLPS